MTLTRKLLLVLGTTQLAVWGIIATQLHFSVTDQFQSFDRFTRDTLRAQLDTAVEAQSMRLHAEARYWLEANTATAAAGLAALPDAMPAFPRAQLRESNVISLFTINGDLLWSAGNNTQPWDTATVQNAAGDINPLITQGGNSLGQHFFLTTTDGPQLAFTTRVINKATGLTEGHLVLARKLDTYFYQQLPALQGRELEVYSAARSVPAELQALWKQATMPSAQLFELEHELGKTFVRYSDVFGNPVVLLAVSSPRFSSTLPRNPAAILMLLVTVVTAIYLLLMGGVIERMVGRPLRQLNRRIAELDTGNTPAEITTTGNEILAIDELFRTLVRERENHEISLSYFASAVEAADDAIAIIDWQGALHYVNPSCEKLTGRNAASLMTESSWWNIVFATNTMKNRTQSADQWEGEIKIRHTDGTVRDVEAKTYKLDQVAAEKAFFVLVMHDISDKNAQIAEIQRLATAVETIEDCIIIADEKGCISYANPAYEKRCGNSLAEMVGKQTNSLSHAASPIPVYEDLQTTVLQGKAWRGELQAVFQDGRKVIDEAVVSPVVNDQGELVNFVTTLHDVTERVSMEEDLRLAKNRIEQANDELEERVVQRTEELRIAKELAEEANVAKSAFLATVSHEIRTPLNGILGMLELLADHPLDGEQKRLLASADTSAELLLALINDILDFSKIEAGQPVDELVAAIDDLEASLDATIQNGDARHDRCDGDDSPEAPYRDENGYIQQCAQCRKVQNRRDGGAWELVAEWTHSMPLKTTHTICEGCAEAEDLLTTS